MLTSNQFRMLERAQQTQVLLDLFRKHADDSGRVVCSPNLKVWLQTQLSEEGYIDVIPRFYDSTYTPAYAMLKSLGMLIRLNKDNSGKVPAILKVDLTTTIPQAKEIKKKINTYFVADLVDVFGSSDNNDNLKRIIESQTDITLATKDRIIAEQKTEIERLENLLRRTIRRADEFARTTRADLKNQTPQP